MFFSGKCIKNAWIPPCGMTGICKKKRVGGRGVSKVFLNADDADDTDERGFYFTDNQLHTKTTCFVICVNLPPLGVRGLASSAFF
jgi:hypothetical protein